MAKTYRCRPSDLLGLENTHDAYCLDSAVHYFGNAVEADLNKIQDKNEKSRERKRDGVLRRYIPELAKEQKFADPGKR